MSTSTEALRHTGHGLHVDWEYMRRWAGRVFTRERIEGFALAAASGAVVTTVLVALYRAMETASYAGAGVAAAGAF